MDANDLKEQGNACMKSGDAKGAIEAYSKAIEADPENHVFHSNRSAAYLKLGESDKALEDAEKCVSMAPEWVKGYARVAQAKIAKGEIEAAVESCAKGLAIEADNAGLLQLSKSANNKLFFQTLKGTWYGEVAEEIGGYVQVFEFKSENSVTITAVGSTMPCSYILDATASPINLDIQIREPTGELILVRHIAKIENDQLYLCSPYLVMPDVRPTEFAGPGMVIMKRGVPGLSEQEEKEKAELDKLTLSERTIRFCEELCNSIAPGTVMGMIEGEPEEVSGQKMTNFVKFQSKIQKMKLRYGNEPELMMQQCLVGKTEPSPDLKAAVEKVRERLVEAGMLEGKKPETAKQQPEAVKVIEEVDSSSNTIAKTENGTENNKGTKEPVVEQTKKIDNESKKKEIAAPVSSPSVTKSSSTSASNSMPLLIGAAVVVGGIALTLFLLKKK